MKPSLAKIYVNAGTYATPNWQELKSVVDATVNVPAEEIEATRRGDAFTGTLPGANNLSVEVTCLWDTSDSVLMGIIDAALNGQSKDIAVLDKPVGTSGAQGPRGYFYIHGLTRVEARNQALQVRFTLRPAADASDAMIWMEVP